MGSDHWLGRLEVDLKTRPKNCPFKFEAFWLRAQGLLKRIEEWWIGSDPQCRNSMYTFQLKIKELNKKLRKWNKEDLVTLSRKKMRLKEKWWKSKKKSSRRGGLMNESKKDC